MRDQLDRLLDFHQTFGVHIETEPTADLPEDVITLRIKLLTEELCEYRQAARDGNLLEVADALTDLLYVLLGTVVSHGLQDDAEELFDEVHRSNMSKLNHGGRPVLRDDGKVLPSAGFSPPDLRKILNRTRERSD
jgi:predicted HAD superfamily Cof-like phosphohydrolase